MRCLVVAIVAITTLSCGTTRHIPDGDYLLKSSKVHVDKESPRDEMIGEDEMKRYVRQSPNKRLFGFNFYIWVYNSAKPDKDNWWNNLKRKVGQEPVYLSKASTKTSEDNIQLYMESEGFYSSQVSSVIDTLSSRRKRASVEYFVRQGTPYRIDKISYDIRDTTLSPLIFADTANSLLHKGDIFSVSLLDSERERITTRLRNAGYYDFTVKNIEYMADTLISRYNVNIEMVINKSLRGYSQRGVARYEDNTQYRIGTLNVVPNFDPTVIINDNSILNSLDTLQFKGINIVHDTGKKPNVRANVLRQMVSLESGELYSAQRVDQTYQNLMSLGYFKSARVTFTPQASTSATNPSGDSLLTGYVLCTPALKQSYNIELEGTTTSSYYGLNTTIGYQNRNIFRGAEAWNVDLSVGYEHMKAPDAIKTRATEIGLATGLTFPRFILPIDYHPMPRVIQPKTEVQVSVNLQNRPYYERTLSSASWGYTWRNRRYSNFLVRPVDLNLVDMKYIDADYYNDLKNDYLKNSYQTQLIAGLTMGYVYNNQRKNVTGNYTMLRLNVETAGNTIYGVNKLLGTSYRSGEDSYQIFGISYAQYVRSDINVSRKLNTGSRTAFVGRLYGGAGWAYGNSSAIPFDRLFYSGGSNSMRGWTPRTLGPGSVDEVADSVYPSQLGDMKLEANLEFRFPIWGDLNGATFFDVGNVWYMKDSEGIYDVNSLFDIDTFYKQLGFNTGFGLRFDIHFAVLRIDWGIQLHNPNREEGSRWVIKEYEWKNTAFNFGVGYPF